MEMVKELRLRTRTLSLRSNITPRGARSEMVRWRLLEASSSNFAFWTTWKYQNPDTSAQNTMPMVIWSTTSRIVIWRRSSPVDVICKSAMAWWCQIVIDLRLTLTPDQPEHFVALLLHQR